MIEIRTMRMFGTSSPLFSSDFLTPIMTPQTDLYPPSPLYLAL